MSGCKCKKVQIVKFCKVRDVKTPTRANVTDAGIDLFIPNDLNDEDLKKCNPNYDFKIYSGEIKLFAHDSILIPAGIKAIIPDNSMLQVNNKSGIATKKELDVMANVIDSDYRGEIHISINNTSNKSVKISLGDKITQMIHIPIFCSVLEELSNDEYEQNKTCRGEGGFGSTGVV